MASKIVDRQNMLKVCHLLFLAVSISLCMNSALATIVSSSGVDGGANKMNGIRCLERERQALVKFKQGLIDEFDHLSSWGCKDCCQWRGIHCSNITGHVIGLDLHNYRYSEHFHPGFYHHYYPDFYPDFYDYYPPLRGSISDSILELHHLSYLDLSFNDFGQSPIPEFIGSLSSLHYLNLAGANFLGSIPHRIANLTNLRSLDLGYNYLTVKSLGWLSHLRFLRYLDLSGADLSKTHWLQSISKLPLLNELHLRRCSLSASMNSDPVLSITNSSSTLSLTTIDLSFNQFYTSSSLLWLFNVSRKISLVDLDLSYSCVQSFPDAFDSMMSLQFLDLHCNFLYELPRSFGNLSHLRSLDLSFNYGITRALTMPLTRFFEEFLNKAVDKSLEFLDLSGNHFSGSLPEFTRFSSLREFYLQGNQLNGSFPASFRQHSNLLVLRLSRNHITGTLPDLLNFPLLQVLDLSYNQLSGPLSESIGELSRLQTLDVSWNSFEGTISEIHFNKLSELKELDLSFNLLACEYNSDWVPPFQLESIGLASCNLGPQFPKWLQTQNNFSRLDISSAGISDTIPNWFWDLPPKLRYLNLSHNQINGFIPHMSLKIVELYEMDLSSNQLEGSLPLLPPNMTLLYLSKNMISGSSSAVCSYKFIKSLDISDNLLSGELPNCWASMEALAVLNMANNNLSGKIPTSIASMNSLETLSLRNNSFTGEIPLPDVYAGSWLRILDLGENMLSGSIPGWLGVQSSRLVVLSLRKNDFSGSIPSNLCNLQDIQVLDLSQNILSGTIPRCFNNFTSLVQRNSTSRTIVVNFTTHNGDLQEYMGNAFVQWKGQEQEYMRTLGLLKSIDLSSNKLIGEIPPEFSSLRELVSLNLSRNNLTGKIIQGIGQMRKLESLDLSANQLSGPIPDGFALLNYLSVLNLSNNKLSGRIPSSTQLQGFNAAVYDSNHGLCGLPLQNKCPGDETAQTTSTTDHHHNDNKIREEEEEDGLVTRGFYISMVIGFAFAFWGVFGTIVVNRRWGNAYFMFLQNMKDWISVTAVVNMARLQRKLRG